MAKSDAEIGREAFDAYIGNDPLDLPPRDLDLAEFVACVREQIRGDIEQSFLFRLMADADAEDRAKITLITGADGSVTVRRTAGTTISGFLDRYAKYPEPPAAKEE